ncbi:MAG: hypothetical protein AB7K68_12565 [Bacteriovoracia bacterium]
MAKKTPAKRQSIRFEPETPGLAWINKTIPALVFSEAFRGCGLVVIEDFAPLKGAKVKVKIGEQPELEGKVVWKEQSGERVVRLGVEFLE